ncbi:hypothetical protein ACIRPT_30325 [Streptomyces sp. NPDC101227]|uniref:hypothetical protein n=1 Tax=Streptomyces sp. NPDC101227 TaxID=3366136 RepID=UPI00381870BD
MPTPPVGPSVTARLRADRTAGRTRPCRSAWSPPPVSLTIERGLRDALPAEPAAAGYRIAREALTNVRKHAADATAVRIRLRAVPDGVELRIANGGGTPARLPTTSADGRFGLAGLTDRAPDTPAR